MKPQSMSSFFPGCRMSALSLFSFFSAISIDLVEWFVCFHQDGPKSLSPQPQKIQKARWPQEGQCQDLWYKGYPVRSLLRTEHRNKDVFPFSWKGLGIAVYCVPDFLFSAGKHIPQIHPEATEWARGITCISRLSLLTCIQLLLWKKAQAVSLLPGPRGSHLCHSHTSITCLTPKQTTWAH